MHLTEGVPESLHYQTATSPSTSQTTRLHYQSRNKPPLQFRPNCRLYSPTKRSRQGPVTVSCHPASCHWEQVLCSQCRATVTDYLIHQPTRSATRRVTPAWPGSDSPAPPAPASLHSEVRVRHDLSTGYGRRARLEAERLQIHPEMLLLERRDPGRTHLRGRQGPAKEESAGSND